MQHNQNKRPSIEFYNSKNEKQEKSKKTARNLAGIALGGLLVAGAIFGVKSLSDYDTAQKDKLFVPNGNHLPMTELLDENAEINFSTLEDDKMLVLFEDGSIRTSPVSANIEKPSTILLNQKDVPLPDARELGSYSKYGDNYFVVKLNDLPEYVQDYVDANDIELSEVDGNKCVFINKIDARVVDADLVQTNDKDVQVSSDVMPELG